MSLRTEARAQARADRKARAERVSAPKPKKRVKRAAPKRPKRHDSVLAEPGTDEEDFADEDDGDGGLGLDREFERSLEAARRPSARFSIPRGGLDERVAKLRDRAQAAHLPAAGARPAPRHERYRDEEGAELATVTGFVRAWTEQHAAELRGELQRGVAAVQARVEAHQEATRTADSQTRELAEAAAQWQHAQAAIQAELVDLRQFVVARVDGLRDVVYRDLGAMRDHMTQHLQVTESNNTQFAHSLQSIRSELHVLHTEEKTFRTRVGERLQALASQTPQLRQEHVDATSRAQQTLVDLEAKVSELDTAVFALDKEQLKLKSTVRVAEQQYQQPYQPRWVPAAPAVTPTPTPAPAPAAVPAPPSVEPAELEELRRLVSQHTASAAQQRADTADRLNELSMRVERHNADVQLALNEQGDRMHRMAEGLETRYHGVLEQVQDRLATLALKPPEPPLPAPAPVARVPPPPRPSDPALAADVALMRTELRRLGADVERVQGDTESLKALARTLREGADAAERAAAEQLGRVRSDVKSLDQDMIGLYESTTERMAELQQRLSAVALVARECSRELDLPESLGRSLHV